MTDSESLEATPAFASPTSRGFEPELTGPPPRRLAAVLDQGPFARSRRTASIVLAMVGAMCLALAGSSWVAAVAVYVVPFEYLDWIGLACLLGAAWGPLERALGLGRWRYVRLGEPLHARIVDLAKVPTAVVNGQPSQYGLRARFLFADPATREVRLAEATSVQFSATTKNRYDAPFVVGDYATAIYLPGRLAKTLQLYAFLDLGPTANLRRAASLPAEPAWKVALAVGGLVAFFAALVGNVYCWGRFQPLDFDWQEGAALVALVAGGILFGGGMLAWLLLHHRAEQARLRREAVAAIAAGRAVEIGTPWLGGGISGWVLRVVVIAGAPFLGAVTGLSWAVGANAWLDASPARDRPARVLEMTETTHAFLFREYGLEIELADGGETVELLATPQQLSRLLGRDRVTALVRPGRFGWAWVADVVPQVPGEATTAP